MVIAVRRFLLNGQRTWVRVIGNVPCSHHLLGIVQIVEFGPVAIDAGVSSFLIKWQSQIHGGPCMSLSSADQNTDNAERLSVTD